jgi:hypothetical protein
MVRELSRQQSQTSAVRFIIQDVNKKSSAICNELGKDAMHQAEAILSAGAHSFSFSLKDRLLE